MGMFVVRSYKSEKENGVTETHHTDVAKQQSKDSFYKEMTEVLGNDNEDFSKYTKKHGYHFTKELAERVSEMMKNVNGQQHSWNTSQIEKILKSLNLDIESELLGDAVYLINKAYAQLFPDILKDEISCFKYAYRIMKDPEGYHDKVFYHWIVDVVKKDINIDWKKFI